MENIVLIGFGGHAKSVADSIERQNKYNIVGYIDNIERNSRYRYLGNDDVLERIYLEGVTNAAICVGYMGKGNIREVLYERVKKIGYNLPIIIDPTAIIAETVVIDEGTFVGKNAIINAEARVGKMVIINTQSLVEHESVVDDFSHVAVAAVLCGQVHVGRSSFIGANATVIQGKNVEHHQLVPAGAIIR